VSTPAREATGELLRFATAGSVDDGKSTLIGRLLYDTKAIFEDQLEQVTRASERRHGAGANGNGHGNGHGNGTPDLALLTDGLRAEREQGITIDVAYRYFSTPKRAFIIADTPGHVRYTRNMVTGASTADLALVLVDARNGVVEQSRRHAFIASLLRIPHLVVCVNKMDLVGYDEAAFDRVVADFSAFAEKLDVADTTFVPVSALHGDNVVDRSGQMPWYDGPTLLHHLEHVHIASDRNLRDARFPVQWVVRPGTAEDPEHHDYRGYAGQVAGGVLRAGDEVVVLPSGARTRIAGIDTFDGEVAEAFPPMSVTLRLEDDLDVSRGDMICRPENRPLVDRRLDAEICWMAETPSSSRGRYLLKHTTQTTRAVLEGLRHRIDVTTLHHDPSVDQLELNDIGRVTIRTAAPLAFDPYARNRTTGAFILVDEATNDTVAAGMLLGAATEVVDVRPGERLSRAQRWAQLGVRGATVWLTGDGAADAATALETLLLTAGTPAYDLAAGGAPDPARTAAALADAGVIAIVAGAERLEAARAGHEERELELIEVTARAGEADAVAERISALLARR
jgi:sulfate adenylyltransferase large subunit